MLRVLVLLLLLANAVYLAWGQGWLLPVGFGPTPQREPQRLAQQIRPQAVELMTSKELARLQARAQATPVMCLQSGLMDETQAEPVRRALQASLPAQAWVFDEFVTAERWIIYMGKFASPADLEKKRAQLTALSLPFETVTSPALAPGLSLGVFDSEEKASTALNALVPRGVRTARLLLEKPAVLSLRLRLPAVDETLQKQLGSVRAALNGIGLSACPATGE